MLYARILNIRIADRCILSCADLQARAGAITAIVGPNGSGKTTLLRALTGEIAAIGDLTLIGIPVAGAGLGAGWAGWRALAVSG